MEWDPSLLALVLILFDPRLSIPCTNPSAVQTEPVHGPAGATALLRVSTSDDHSKDSHLCEAEYELVITLGAGMEAKTERLLTSDGDYHRKISMQLDGFSENGARVFGTFAEEGKYPANTLFVYDTTTEKVELIDLKKQFVSILSKLCQASCTVAGTADSGTPIVELSSDTKCAPDERWIVGNGTRRPRRLPQGVHMLNLYSEVGPKSATAR